MKSKILRHAFLVASLAVGPVCAGQTIKIRVVNDKTGQPLENLTVSISLTNDRTGEAGPSAATRLQLTTDSKGEARFSLPEPPPAHLAAQVHLTSEHWHCGCAVMASTQDIVQNGILGQGDVSRPKNGSVSMTPEPGEILVLAHPFTFFERLFYPFVKE